MSKKQMKTEIVDELYTADEIRSMELNDDFILRMIQENELGEIGFFARLG
jgi:hypothetical protein